MRSGSRSNVCGESTDRPMQIEQSFFVDQPREVVWRALQDTALMVECLPGAQLAATLDADHLEGTLTAKLGPVSAAFRGEVAIERDHESRTGTMHARGADRRTGTRVRAAIRYALTERDGGTEITMDSDVSLMGSLAQFARQALIEKVAAKLIAQFAEALEAQLSGESRNRSS